MAKPNKDMSDLSCQQKMHFEALKYIADKYPDVSFYRMCNTRKRGFRVNVYGKDIIEVWCDCPDSPVENAGYLDTKHIPTDEQSGVVKVHGRDYSPIMNTLFDKYHYHEDWGYKWGIWISSKERLINVIESIINSYAMTLDRTL